MIYNRQAIHIAVLLWGCIFSLLMAFCLHLNREVEKTKKTYMLGMQLSCAVLMGSDAAAWAFRGSQGEGSRWVVLICNFLVFFMSDMILLMYHRYVCCCLFEQNQKEAYIRRKLVAAICILAMFLVILSQFTHFYYEIDAVNIYHRNAAYFVSMLLPMAGGLLDFTLLVQYRQNISHDTRKALISYLILPLAASLIQIFYYGISFSNIAICISLVLMFVETVMSQNRKILEQERRIAQQELEIVRQEQQLTQRRVASMMSQMKAHFIFNVLTTISGYCKIDPEKADQALIRFSRYLRRNIRFLEEEGLVSFTTEEAQLDDYVALQQMRFPDRITYEKELEETNFLIPPLTIQPIMENSIKHGLIEQDKSGTVRLTTRKEKDGVRIEVTDDGAGFDLKELEKGDSVGIRNVRYRLEKMTDATMKMESIVGVGTRVVIHIPTGVPDTDIRNRKRGSDTV